MKNVVLHYYGGTSDKVYVGSIEKNAAGHYAVLCRWGRRNGTMKTTPYGIHASLSGAESELDEIVRSKKKKGYQDIESPSYRGVLRIDSSWLSSYLVDTSAPAPQAQKPLAIAPDSAEEIDRVLSDAVRKQASELLAQGQKILAVKAVRTATNALLAPAKAFVEKILEPEVKAKKAATSNAKDYEVVCVNNLGMEDSFDEEVTYVAEKHPDSDMIYVYDRNGEKRECFKERFKKLETEVSSLKDMRFKPVTGTEKLKITGEPLSYRQHYA